MAATNTDDEELKRSAQAILTASGMLSCDVERLLGSQPTLAKQSSQASSCPSARGVGPEQFAPVTAPRMHRSVLPGSVPLIPMGGATWLEEMASEPQGKVASWGGDLEKAHADATSGLADLLHTYYEQEHNIFAKWVDCPWPTSFTDAEQFYTLRDAINYTEQWIPGDCLRYPGLVGVVGLGVAADECVIYSKDIASTCYLGLTISEWELIVRKEVALLGGDPGWLDVGFSSLYACICLQNLEKAMLGGAPGVRTASMDWKSLSGYFTRCEIALTAVTSFFIAAYSGVRYREQDVRPISIAAASNAIMFDLAKRATGQGGGNVTEVDLGGDGNIELRMRAHLASRLLSYGCTRLPTALPWVLYRCWESTCIMPLLNDRYVERVQRRRAPVPHAFLKKMDNMLRATGGQLRVPELAGTDLGGSGSKVAGWDAKSWVRADEDGNVPGKASAGFIAKHTPEVWLTALAASTPGTTGSVPDESGPPDTCFTSLFDVVREVETAGSVQLQSFFDGAGYAGRPIGGLM